MHTQRHDSSRKLVHLVPVGESKKARDVQGNSGSVYHHSWCRGGRPLRLCEFSAAVMPLEVL
jgi:hypothetical protein